MKRRVEAARPVRPDYVARQKGYRAARTPSLFLPLATAYIEGQRAAPAVMRRYAKSHWVFDRDATRTRSP